MKTCWYWLTLAWMVEKWCSARVDGLCISVFSNSGSARSSVGDRTLVVITVSKQQLGTDGLDWMHKLEVIWFCVSFSGFIFSFMWLELILVLVITVFSAGFIFLNCTYCESLVVKQASAAGFFNSIGASSHGIIFTGWTAGMESDWVGLVTIPFILNCIFFFFIVFRQP